jgi:hypothetical protein
MIERRGHYDVVIPTLGRQSLDALLASLIVQTGPHPERLIVVDDRRVPTPALAVPAGAVVVASGRRGPAAARNAGAQLARAPWVVFLDDDVVLTCGWCAHLARELARARADVAAIHGRIVVPRPEGRRGDDWERNVGSLESAWWATADLAVRRVALAAVGGFDERFPRAHREDADLALRLDDDGWLLARGARTVEHPVRPAPWLLSVRKQAGNADDALMRRVHGPDWRTRANAGRGTLTRHVVTVALLAGAVAATAARSALLTVALLVAWFARTAALAWRRLAPGPRTARDIAAMLVTSALIPPAAVAARLVGEVRARRLAPRAPVFASDASRSARSSRSSRSPAA